jgi:hypothetical protein
MCGVRKAETSDERGEWTVESADAWRKRKQGLSDERVKRKGYVSELFFIYKWYTNFKM